MTISQEAIEKILGMERGTLLEPKDMARNLIVTFYPANYNSISDEVKSFGKRLEKAFLSLGVKIIPYEQSLARIPARKIARRFFRVLFYWFISFVKKIFSGDNFNEAATIDFKALMHMKYGKKVKKGISIIALGEGKTGNLPMDNIMSFRDSNVVTIVDMPSGIGKDTDFHKHFDTAMNLFAHHMTNIVIAVDKNKWLLYNFNASHPIYPLDNDFEKYVLHALIPKIFAPIKSLRLFQFVVRPNAFDPNDELHKPITEDLLQSGLLLEKTGLYPPGKNIAELPFRNEFYKWIGRIHLDYRTGMSYGFLARQMPVTSMVSLTEEEFKQKYGNIIFNQKGFVVLDNHLYLILHAPKGKIFVLVPEVWIMTLRSGANKTHPDPQKDLIKIGLVNGIMFLETPKGTSLRSDYKPSFDTQVILAHAVGNAIIGAALYHFDPNNIFSKALGQRGLALAHWHGYFKKDKVPFGWHIHGEKNPHVACSTSQSAIFALDGKMKVLLRALAEQKPYYGDVHIEPHHGVNITFTSLEELGEFLLKNSDNVSLGNRYLEHY